MDQIVEWLGVVAINQIQSNCMVELCVCVCVCVLFVWLSKGFVKGDIWSWPIEVQEKGGVEKHKDTY